MRRSLSVSSVVFSLITAMCGISAARQQNAPAEAPQPIAVVSFDLFHNRVYLPVQVNGDNTITMVLDTGAAFSGLSESAAKAMQLKTSGTAHLAGNGESNQKIALARDVRFRVGGAELIEKSVAIVPFQDLESHEGRAIAGVLGVNLFRNYVVEIDYAGKTLSLFEPKTFAYRGPGIVVPLRFKGAALFQANIYVAGQPAIPAELAIDSGTYSAVRLYRPFSEKHKLVQHPQTSGIASFGFGIGGEFPEELKRISALEIGSLQLHAPVASISEAHHGATASGALDGTIGGAILCRFKVTLDYPRAQMILEPNATFADPFDADTSGLILSASGADLKTISIRHVLPDTPASAAGIKDGDVLLVVNGQEAGSLGLEGIRLLFCQAGAYHLQLRRGSQNLAADMTTQLIP